MRSLYIDGSWQDSASSEALDVVNPATEQVIDAVPAGAAEDVDRAVAAAAAAFPTWSELPPAERVAFLAKALEMFNSRRSEEHTSELQSRFDLVCRLLLEKKKS